MDLEIYDGNTIISEIDFGRPETGSNNFKTLYLKNNSELWPIHNITLTETLDDDILIEYPKQLNPKELSPIIIKWTPKFERRKPLDITQIFSGDLMIGVG